MSSLSAVGKRKTLIFPSSFISSGEFFLLIRKKILNLLNKWQGSVISLLSQLFFLSLYSFYGVSAHM